MDALRSQCEDASAFPQNMPLSGLPKYAVDRRYNQLNEQSSSLFCNPERANLEFLEFGERAKGQFAPFVRSGMLIIPWRSL